MARDNTTTPQITRSYNNADVGESDDAPLLGNGTRKVHDELREGTGTLGSGIGNLLNTIVGTGMLSFPLVS